jgi:hypothetical protein
MASVFDNLNNEEYIGGPLYDPNYIDNLSTTKVSSAFELGEKAKIINQSTIVEPEFGPLKSKTNSIKNAMETIKNNKLSAIGTAANTLATISTYKEQRRKGRGVVSSGVRAAADFAMGEALGMAYPLVLLAKEIPGGIIKGADMLYKENRRMNSAANFQVFGGSEFHDTQQLATMRQSGMEMAKMAQYNLQQTLMGQEATYLHR